MDLPRVLHSLIFSSRFSNRYTQCVMYTERAYKLYQTEVACNWYRREKFDFNYGEVGRGDVFYVHKGQRVCYYDEIESDD